MLQIISEKNSSNLLPIIETIQKSGKEIMNISIDKPALEGVFLSFTGRTLRD